MAEPITRDHAKQQLRVISEDEDELIDDVIRDARGWVENYTGLKLVPGEVVEHLTSFGDRLTTWPINSITSVGYTDPAFADLILDPASYRIPLHARGPVLRYGSIATWPLIAAGSAITVTMQAGYPDPADIPRNLLRAMKLLITGFYEDREGGGLKAPTEAAAMSLCRNFKRWTV